MYKDPLSGSEIVRRIQVDRRTGKFYWVVYTDALTAYVLEVSYQTAPTPLTYENRFWGDIALLKYHTSRQAMLI